MNKVLGILETIRPEFDFAASEDFVTDGMLDSFDIVTLVAELEKRFSVSIDGTEIVPENFSSLNAIQSLLKKHGAGQ